MEYKEEALRFLGITEWHKSGYTGKGIKIMSDESVYSKKHPDVISPSGFSSKRGHGDDVMSHIKLVAPDAEHIAYPFNGIFGSQSYTCNSAEYIKNHRVHVFTTSNLGSYPTQGRQKAIRDCIDAGCIFFAAAGNGGEKGLRGESRFDGYLAIGGIKPKYKNGTYNWNNLYKVSYSAVGKELDYVTMAETMGAAGTSFCAPVFAAMVGLVQQFFLEKAGRVLKPSEMVCFINDNLLDVDAEGFDVRTGHGLFRLPDPETIKISNYVTDIDVGDLNENIYYGGIPQVEEIKIKQMLLTPSEYTRPQTPIKPTAIAWHYVGNPNSTAVANRNYFESLKDSHETKASSHYIIGLEGEIIQCIPDDEMSYCTNDANSYTISVECCHPDNTGKFTEATYKSMVWLGKHLMQKHGIKNNIRHYDVTGKICPKWFVDNPKEWEKFKNELEVEELIRYKSVEEMPQYAQEPIQELIDKGILAGKGGELGLDLSEDMIRLLILTKKIFEQGV